MRPRRLLQFVVVLASAIGCVQPAIAARLVMSQVGEDGKPLVDGTAELDGGLAVMSNATFSAPVAKLRVEGARNLRFELRKQYAWLWANKHSPPRFVPDGTPAETTPWVAMSSAELTGEQLRDFSDIPLEDLHVLDPLYAPALAARPDAPKFSSAAAVPRYLDVRVSSQSKVLGIARIAVLWDCNAQ